MLWVVPAAVQVGVVVPGRAAPWWCGDGCVDRRSAAGDWLLWFALGGGPPDFWQVPGPDGVSGRRGPCRAGLPPGKGIYAAASSSAGFCPSMMMLSTSLGVYPHVTSWFR